MHCMGSLDNNYVEIVPIPSYVLYLHPVESRAFPNRVTLFLISFFQSVLSIISMIIILRTAPQYNVMPISTHLRIAIILDTCHI